MITPTIDEVRKLVAEHPDCNLVPIYKELAADLETPVSAFLKARTGTHSFLFESVEKGEKLGRYSFIGTSPIKMITSGPGTSFEGDPLVQVEEELKAYKPVPIPNLPPFLGGAIGYVTYDSMYHFEPSVQPPAKDSMKVPESIFLICDSLLAFDHVRHTIMVVAQCHVSEDLEAAYANAVEKIVTLVDRLESPITPMPADSIGPEVTPAEPVSNIGEEGYKEIVSKFKEHIFAGNIIQAVPSHRLSYPTTLHPFNIYRQLRIVNPSPYMFFMDLDNFQIIGASPELLVKVDKGVITTHPIAGTRKRGKTPEEDLALEKDLLSDEKELAEHIMLVDLGRNDVGRISKPGTVRVDSMMHIEKYSHVMHIVSNVSGQLREDRSVYDAFRAIFPAGTVSGAPKIRAMQLIAEHEKERRGIYAGSVGYIGFNGTMDTCIAIRTMVYKDHTIYFQAGAGIVFDSVPESEYLETMTKMRASLRAVQQAESIYFRKVGASATPKSPSVDTDPRGFWAKSQN